MVFFLCVSLWRVRLALNVRNLLHKVHLKVFPVPWLAKCEQRVLRIAVLPTVCTKAWFLFEMALLMLLQSPRVQKPPAVRRNCGHIQIPKRKKGRCPVWVRLNKDSRSHISVQEYVCLMIANTVTMWKLHNIKQMMSLLVFWGNMVYLCMMMQVSSICFLRSCWFSLELLKVDHFNLQHGFRLLYRSAGAQKCFGYNNILRHWMCRQAGDRNSGCSIPESDFSVPSVDLWSSEPRIIQTRASCRLSIFSLFYRSLCTFRCSYYWLQGMSVKHLNMT